MRITDEIIGGNLERMASAEKGGMLYLEILESMADKAEGYKDSAVVINFFYDGYGRINYFGNYQEVPEEIRKKDYRGVFMVVREPFKDKIVKLMTDARSSCFVSTIIGMTAEEFNKKQEEKEKKRFAQ